MQANLFLIRLKKHWRKESNYILMEPKSGNCKRISRAKLNLQVRADTKSSENW